MSVSKQRPLIETSPRQAFNLNKGLVYQIWKSVEAWTKLTEEQALFLEGVEDFDIVDSKTGTIVQTKATAAKLTLRSDAIISALKSFWSIQGGNKDIFFRLITTSIIGKEASNPFGNNKGLDLWKTAARKNDSELAAKIRLFLLTDSLIKSTLHSTKNHFQTLTFYEFLQNSTADEVLDKLIKKISWETDGDDSDYVKEDVRMFLYAHGDKLQVRPSDCEPALDRLFRIAAEIASKKKERILTRGDFLREFEQATSKNFTPSELSYMLNLNHNNFLETPPNADWELNIGRPNSNEDPQLFANIVGRECLIKQVSETLNHFKSVVIHGSTGMGKSTLAKLTITKVVDTNWLWIDLKCLTLEKFSQTLKSLAVRLINSTQKINLVLDNLDFSISDLFKHENSIAVVTKAIKNLDGNLIITTNQKLPLRFTHKLNLAHECFFEIPYFNEEEIKEFCLKLGYAGTRINFVSNVILHQTLGHPQLIHARLIKLSTNSWPQLSSEELLNKPIEVIEEQEVARQLLNDIPNEDKELLYRLSIACNPFRKDHILAISQIEPKLPFASDSLVRLIGPWIEIINNEYFRLSPLLSDAAKSNWSKEELKVFRDQIINAILSCSNKSLIEAEEILLQALHTENKQAIDLIVFKLNTISFDSIKKMSEVFSWLALLGRSNGKKIFPKNLNTNLALRLLQFRIINECFPKDINSLCAIVDEEFKELETKKRKAIRFFWLIQTILYSGSEIDPEFLIKYWVEVSILSKESISQEFIPKIEEAFSKISKCNYRDNIFIGHLLKVIFLKRGSAGFVLNLIQAIEQLPKIQKQLAIRCARENIPSLRTAIDQLCVNQSLDDFGKTLSCLDKIHLLAKKWKFLELEALLYRIKAIIEYEFLGNLDAGLKLLNLGIDLKTNQTYLLEDQKANILFRRKEFSNAFEIWKRVLLAWPDPVEDYEALLKIYAIQRASKCAEHFSKLDLIITWFQIAQQEAKKWDLLLNELTFLVDESLVHWKLGKKQTALIKIADVLQVIEFLSSKDKDDPLFYRLYQAIEEVIAWFYNDLNGAIQERFEPPIGFCSQPEENSRFRDLPRQPIDNLWYHLANIELQANAGREIFNKAVRRISSSNLTQFQASMERLKLSVMFQEKELGPLLQQIITCDQKLDAVLRKKGKDKEHAANILLWAEVALIVALIIQAESDIDLKAFLKTWFKDVECSLKYDELRTRLIKLSEIADAAISNVYDVYKDNSKIVFEHLLAALRLAIDRESTLIQAFYGQLTLVLNLANCEFKEDVEGVLGMLIKRIWEHRINFKAEFSMPYLNIPLIKTACQKPFSGFKQAAHILLQVQSAIPNVRIPTETINQLKLLEQ